MRNIFFQFACMFILAHIQAAPCSLLTTFIQDNKLYLSSSNGAFLINAIGALKKLAQNIHEPIPTQPVRLKTADSGTFYADITLLIPSSMRNLFITGNAAYYGPNCWNTVLYFYNIIPHIRYTTHEEFTFYMNDSRYFRPVIEDQPQVDDIGVLQEGEEIYHAFIFIENDLILHKTGCGRSDPYEFNSLRNVCGFYCRCTLTFYRRTEIRQLSIEETKDIDDLEERIICIKNHTSEHLNVPKITALCINILQSYFDFHCQVARLRQSKQSLSQHHILKLYRWIYVLEEFEEILRFRNITIQTTDGRLLEGLFVCLIAIESEQHIKLLDSLANQFLEPNLQDLDLESLQIM